MTNSTRWNLRYLGPPCIENIPFLYWSSTHIRRRLRQGRKDLRRDGYQSQPYITASTSVFAKIYLPKHFTWAIVTLPRWMSRCRTCTGLYQLIGQIGQYSPQWVNSHIHNLSNNTQPRKQKIDTLMFRHWGIEFGVKKVSSSKMFAGLFISTGVITVL